MTLKTEEQKLDTIAAAARLAATRLDPERAPPAERFLRCFYDHVPPADLLPRSPEDLYGAALSLWQFAQQRPTGRAKLRLINPRLEERGWHSACTVLEIVNDDMPFLVDSVTAALNGAGVPVHLVIHPILRVERDGEGKLLRLIEPAAGNGAGRSESLMHVEIAEVSDPERLAQLAGTLERVLADVRAATSDWPAMRAALHRIREDLAREAPAVPQEEASEALDFLAWLDDDNVTFLGYRDYQFGRDGNGGKIGEGLDIVPGSGLGILRDDAYSVFDGLRSFKTLPPDVKSFLLEPRLLIISKSNRRSTVHRAVRMDAIGVKRLGPNGEAVGLRVFVGLFTSLAFSRSPRAIPLLRRKIDRTLERSGFDPASHDGKALLHILDRYPRDELFQVGADELFDIALGILGLQERQRIALFARRDPFGRFVSCLIYVPRDRYTTELRRRFAEILEKAYAAKVDAFGTHIGEDVLARVHFVLRAAQGTLPEVDVAAVERLLAEAGQSWADNLQGALVEAHGEEAGLALFRRYAESFPTSYRERFSAAAAPYDIERLEEVRHGLPLGMTLYRPIEAQGPELRFKIYRQGAPVALSDILPMLEHMGLRVVTEVPYQIDGAGEAAPIWMQDFGLLAPGGEVDVPAERARFEEAFARIWAGDMESDGLNRLVLSARLDWRQVMVLRLYVKVMRQAGSTFSQAYIEDAIARHPALAADLVHLFEARFDPAHADAGKAATSDAVARIEHALDDVASLDEDRILRSLLTLVTHSLRTNYYQRAADGAPKPYLSVKLESHAIDLFPLPRPLYEIYVLSPRMEGVHLRGGKVARGGIRWSDRKEDFRTEILGLMKAQMVKNAVIVPTGSKGGFVVKRPPPASQGRDALQTEVIECYKTLMRGLLDLTDNIVGDKVAPPQDVVRHDGDDPYLVVAADKGTATFSDIANAASAEYGFWLDDAFASGGSAGYDHKAMGITARGAWETVKRHFRELGRDIQTTDFTCVGVGDMSGDVFGNGMLRSRHTRLLAAFDHRHIFLDPDPDPAVSFAERQRLFDLPRSSWADYDKSLISPGGGVFERGLKSIPLSPQVRARLGLAAEHLTPPELIQAILKASVDLLWFGGIGTYVKASDESNAEAGDRANDALRIDASGIRAQVVGEGANLAVTQRGRIEYALQGGHINTDAIDNSAGVDTSDHEVNIKVLLNAVVASGDMTLKQRNALLHEMTDEVASLVLRDNYLQGLALTLAEAQRVERFDEHVRVMRGLERAQKLDRAVEFLPDDETLGTRAAQHQGLTRPELAVLLAYVKNTLADELIASNFPDDPQLEEDLFAYFPKVLVDRFRAAIEGHRLRREIIATVAANDLVNHAGIAFVQGMIERSGRGPGDVARAYIIVRQVFGLDALWAAIDGLDNRVPAALQTEMLLAIHRLLERATAWFLRGASLDIRAQVETFRAGVAELAEHIGEIMPETHVAELDRRVQALVSRGAPEDIAQRVTRLDFLSSAVDIVRLANERKGDATAFGRSFFTIGARFRLDALRLLARKLAAESAWQKLAVSALIEDLYGEQAALTAKAAAAGDFERWLAEHAGRAARLDGLLREIDAAPQPDLAMLTVASRALRGILTA